MALRRLLPTRGDYDGLARSWRADVVAGITVGIVALPLALAFGITTGLGASVGLITAIVAGLVAAIFGGSHVQVSGPTGAMTVVLVPLVHREGAGAVVIVGLLAGVLLIIDGMARLGRYLSYIPWPVVEGFTLGIAVIILLQQVPAALGVTKPAGENTAAVAARAVARSVGHGSLYAVGIVALVAVTMVVLPRLHRSIPVSLFAVSLATLLTSVGHRDVATIGTLPSSLAAPGLPAISLSTITRLAGAAFSVAVLSALESLLSAKVADGMGDTQHHDPDRELFGQGLANLASSLFGGMPATGAIARTAVNIRAGARTRVASVVHAVFLIGVVYLGSGLVARIPLAALAGVLMVTAMKMVETHHIRAILRSTRSDAGVLVLTAGATIAFDLITAVELGILGAGFLALRKLALGSLAESEIVPDGLEVSPAAEASLLSHHIVAYRIDGALFFGAAQRFLREFTAIADIRVAILRLGDVRLLDASGASALSEITEDLEGRGITVLLQGVRPEHLRVLESIGALDRLAHENHLFTDLEAAIEHAKSHVGRPHPVSLN